MAFQEKDAPVFFGRDVAIQEGLDRLHSLRRYGGKALLLVLGASGCGKSSLMRAGIVPRLRRDPENWLVLDPFRPRLDPFTELAESLSKAFTALSKTPPEEPKTAADLQRQLEDLRRASGQREATVVIPIDQFEELLGDGGDSAADQGIGGDPFLAFLRQAMQDTSGRLVVLATLRSDFLGTFQCHPKLLGLPVDQFLVGPMEVEGYTQVIEGPADVAGLTLEPGLSERLVADTPPADLAKLFSVQELADAGEGPGRAASLAARFAAKEACLKLFPREAALGSLVAADFSVERDDYGAPRMTFAPAARTALDRHRIGGIAKVFGIARRGDHGVAVRRDRPHFWHQWCPERRPYPRGVGTGVEETTGDGTCRWCCL
jgi:phosphopantetheinyl transferase (holo-ACP synthase)